MDWTYSENERHQMEETLHRATTQEREKIKRTTKQFDIAKKEGTTWSRTASDRLTTMENTDGGLHPAVDGQGVIL